MGLFDIFRKKQPSVLDALQALPGFKQLDEIQSVMAQMCEAGDGVDADEIPNGTGEFGFTPTNHIPTKTVFGSTAYLGRLRASDGTKVTYQRNGSMTVDGAPGPVDIYSVSHQDGRKLATVYLCPYHKRISRRAPNGFRLAEHSFAR